MNAVRLRALLIGSATAVMAAALLAQEPDPRLPAPPVLPPIPEELSRPMGGDLRVVFTDVSFTRRGARVRVPYVEVVQAPGSGPGAVRLSLLDIRGASVSLPADAPERRSDEEGPGQGFDTAILFLPVTGRPINVGRVRIRDATLEQRGAGGWRYRDIDADVRDVVLGGSRTEGLRVLSADFDGVVGGRHLRLHRAAARVRRTASRIEFTTDFALGSSAGALAVSARRSGAVSAEGELRTDDFAELHAWVDALPRTGTGILAGRYDYDGGRFTGELRTAELRVGESRVAARGALTEGAVHDVVLDIHRLTAIDLHAAFGTELPGGGALHGRFTADGPLARGVAVAGDLTRIAPAPAAAVADGNGTAANGLAAPRRSGPATPLDTAALQLKGLVREDQGYHVALDLTVDAGALGDRLLTRDGGDSTAHAPADSAAGARLEPVHTQLSAHVDVRSAALPVRGRMDVRSELVLRDGRMIPVGAEVEGMVELRGARGVDVVIRPDSLPLGLLPAPAAVTDVAGVATGEVRVTGTLSEPRWRGWVAVADAGLRVPRAGTGVAGVAGRVEVDGYEVSTMSLRGRLGEGALEVSGGAVLGGGERSLDVRLRLDGGQVVGLDSLRVVASAELRAAGVLEAPVVTGEVVVEEGVFLEDMTKHRRPLDLEDPPYAAVAARTPWLGRSRLLPPAPPPTRGPAAGPRLDLDVVVTEGFRILDEDSEMYGVGRVRLRGDVAALDASGSYRVTGGEYNNFGERFRVVGGIFHFPGVGFTSRVSLRAQHDHGAPVSHDLGSDGRAADYFPPLEFFALGSLSGVTEEVRRLALLRERQTELAALLLYGEQVEPITGWMQRRYWRSEGGESLFGPRARSQAVPLLWAYIADEGYDWLPLDRAYLRAGAVRVGPPFPGRLTATGIVAGGLRFDRLEVDVRQPTDAAALAGVQVRYTLGRWRLIALNEPRFRGAIALPGFDHVRRTGLRVQWGW